MGSSENHEEKRDCKKHIKERSLSRERDRDSYKKSHISSHHPDKRKSPEPGTPNSDIQLSKKRLISEEEEILPGNRESSRTHPRVISDEEFDVDQLLESKYSENPEFSSLRQSSQRHKDDTRKRHMFDENEDYLEKFATEQLLEEHGAHDIVRRSWSPPAETPLLSDVRIKEEPQGDGCGSPSREFCNSLSLPSMAAETNRVIQDEPTSTEKKMLDTMLNIQAKLNEVVSTLNILVRKESNDDDAPFFHNLPAISLQSLREFEQLISVEDTFCKALKQFANRGGRDLRTTTRNILQCLMTDEVAALFNWAGRGGKEEFRKLKLKNLVLIAVRENIVTKDAICKDVEDAIKDWLKYAPVRMARGRKQDQSQDHNFNKF